MTERDALKKLIQACSGLSPHHVPSTKDWNAIRDAVKAGMEAIGAASEKKVVINYSFEPNREWLAREIQGACNAIRSMGDKWLGMERDWVVGLLSREYPHYQWRFDDRALIGELNGKPHRFDASSVLAQYLKSVYIAEGR